MSKVAAVLNFVFGCRHRQLSRVFTIDRRTYRVCCDCGRKFDYALERMSMVKALGEVEVIGKLAQRAPLP